MQNRTDKTIPHFVTNFSFTSYNMQNVLESKSLNYKNNNNLKKYACSSSGRSLNLDMLVV